jgi:hypothetical protein
LGSRDGPPAKPFIPLRAPGCPASAVKPPLSEVNSLDATDRNALYILLDQIEAAVLCTRASPAAYSRHIDAVATFPASPAAEPNEPQAILRPEAESTAPSLSMYDEELLVSFVELENRGRHRLDTERVSQELKWERSVARHRLDGLKRAHLLMKSSMGDGYLLTEKGRELALGIQSARSATTLGRLLGLKPSS